MSTEKNELYDLNDVPSTENGSAALIEKAGIHHNLKVAISLVDGEYKVEDRKGEKWHAFQVKLTNNDGLELSENYFCPPQKVEDVKYVVKKYELVEGKSVETRDCTELETLKVLNNEFLAYLIDLGEAFGFKHDDVKAHLYKNAKGFTELANAFISKFKPSETTRISAKLLYNNNKKKETSYLQIHGPYNVYYPYGNDLFDIYKEGRDTLLKLSNWEATNKLKKQFDNTKPQNDETITKGVPKALDNEEDPF